ncbi:hypothetical protein A5792_11555 [Mycolicibacterium peregrinum]|uniref:Uncharacterized protein n=1 Tax=Mycolicibacterium peregrinum TaxID=43304 RepID=A0A1A0RG30_MYCPR|nr:hypothetical protein [Mycolicibacterium peregrinum]OBB33058.1 hypothetical protein A5792_11555 [Mycolicibacterium peregrinum]
MPAPIATAYDGALSVTCGNCGAGPGDYCIKESGQLRRTPCVTRCRAITPEVGSVDPEPYADAAEARTAPARVVVPDQPTLDYADPSEPRHPRGDE